MGREKSRGKKRLRVSPGENQVSHICHPFHVLTHSKWDSNCTKQLILLIKVQLNSSESWDNGIVVELPY